MIICEKSTLDYSQIDDQRESRRELDYSRIDFPFGEKESRRELDDEFPHKKNVRFSLENEISSISQ
jgi:hypothetical protein